MTPVLGNQKVKMLGNKPANWDDKNFDEPRPVKV